MTQPDLHLPADRLGGYFSANKWLLFAALSLGFLLDIVIRNYFLITDELYFATYGTQVALDEISSMNELRKDYGWMAFPAPVLVMLFRVSFTAICLNIGAILSGRKVRFRDLFGIALCADLLFLIHSLLLTLLLMTVVQPSTLNQVNTYGPFSLLGVLKLFGVREIQVYYLYPLQALHIFEVLYWFFLALGMQYVYRASFWRSFKMVMSSYGLGLLLWLVTVVFFLVLMNLSKG